MVDIRPLAFPQARAAGVQPGSPARAEAVRAAQRAFFQAALNEAQAAPAPVASRAAPKVEPATTAVSAAAPADPAARYARPGSRLDIKV
ncbi:MAG: hypothetical protein J7516_15570 [Shinella sp.]|nr:hypothetical protein [Shinella sp.]